MNDLLDRLISVQQSFAMAPEVWEAKESDAARADYVLQMLEVYSLATILHSAFLAVIDPPDHYVFTRSDGKWNLSHDQILQIFDYAIRIAKLQAFS